MKSEQTVHILIAEDEPIILNNIAKKAQKAGSWVSIAGKAESGSQALSILEQTSVDILITDIEMPGINGLELIREVREHYPSVRIVILSGYSNFEYARTALRYGVNDYLLKPVAQDVFSELLLKLKEEVTAEKTKKKREILSMALLGPESSTEVPSALQDGSFYLLCLTLGNYAEPSASLEVSTDYTALWELISPEEFIHTLPDVKYVWMIDETYALSKFFILHTASDKLSPDYLRLAANRYFSEHFPGIPYTLLLSSHAMGYPDIWNSAKALRLALRQYSRPFAQDAFLESELSEERLPGMSEFARKSNVLHSLTTGKQFFSYVTDTLEELLNNGSPSRLILKFISEAFAAAETLFLVSPAMCRNALSAIYRDFHSLHTKKELTDLLMHHLKALQKQQTLSLPGESLCEKITQYIQYNYCTRLSLNDLSEHFGYTASYINRIFKKELGVSPLQYITTLKIEKAKELLRSPTPLDIREIAAAIGYEDARYFSRVFKNETGMTPTSWATTESP